MILDDEIGHRTGRKRKKELMERKSNARRALFFHQPTGPSFVREIEAFEYTLDRSIRNQPTSDSSGLSKKVVIRQSEASRESESCAPQSTLVCNPAIFGSDLQSSGWLTVGCFCSAFGVLVM